MDLRRAGDRASPPSEEPRVGVRPALRAAAVYAVVGALWILASDRLVHLVVRDPEARTVVQTIKGWAFVAVTAVLGFELVRRAVRERARADAAESRARDRVRRLEERLRAFLDHSPNGVLLLEPDGRIVYANDRAEAIFGYERGTLIGRHLEELVPERLRERHAAHVPSFLREPTPRRMGEGREVTGRRRDGSEVPLEIALTAFHEPQGTTVAAVISDLTARRRMELEVFRLNRALRAIRACNQAMLRLRDERELLREVCRIVVEEGGYRMAWVGYRRDDERKTVEPVAWAGYESGYLASADITWADEPRGRGPTGTAIRTGEPCVVQRMEDDPRMAPWRHAARERRFGSSIALPLVLDGKVLGALSIYASVPDAFGGEEVALLREMSEDLAFGIGAIRIRAERERLLARLEALVEIDREILAAGSVERVAKVAVRRARRLVGAERATLLALQGEAARILAIDPAPTPDAVGRVVPIGALVTDPADLRRPWFFAPDLATRSGVTPEQGEAWRGIRGAVGVPLRLGEEILGVLGAVSGDAGIMTEENARALRDLADAVALAMQQHRLRQEIERHAAELERRVEERTAELRERNAELDAFSASVSHDLRAPLRAVQGFARALLEDHAEGLDPTGRAFVERIVRVAERMDRLMADLLAYSRLGREALTPARVPLDEIVGEVLELLRADIEASGATVEVAPDLPAVAADPRALTQVLMNLVGNALKFVGPGVPPRVRISATEREGWVRLEVADYGIGIPPEHRERIFQPLERLHGVDRYPGTGIGLAIVRRGVERMGGRCGVASEPGRGSVFWVELPSAPAQVGPAPAEAT